MKLNALSLGLLLGGSLAEAASQPNILFILTDDQDNHMGSVEHMEALHRHIVSKGTTYSNHYCTVSLCCPSRATLWTGLHAHNHNVTSVKPPYGGYTKILNQGINDDYLPLWLQGAGYNTYYAGKLWNAYGIRSMPGQPAKGFTGSDILLDPYTYRYYQSGWSRDGGDIQHYNGQYSPDLTAHKASAYLDEALEGGKPWFLVAAPVAPHNQVAQKPVKHPVPPPSAPRHEHLFKDFQIPRTPGFNPAQPAGASYIRHLPPLSEAEVEKFDEWQRARLRALQSVDEMIDELVTKVEKAGVMDNTYIIFSTDNGFHLGQLRMRPGKKCAYETDINIPLFIRGPGVPEGGQTDAVSAHVDLTPTFMKLAGAGLRDTFDGEPIGLTQEEFDKSERRTEHTQAEFWGANNVKGMGAQPNTYKAVRVIGSGYNLAYTVWCTNEHELYDVNVNNLYRSAEAKQSYQLFGRPFQAVAHRLDALTMILKTCKGDVCRNPWKKIHQNGKVKTLREALDEKFDHLYKKQPKVRFDACAIGYLKDVEGPDHVIPAGHKSLEADTESSWDTDSWEDVSGSDELELRKRWTPPEGMDLLWQQMRDIVDDDSPEWLFEDDPEFDSDDEDMHDAIWTAEKWEI